MANDNSTETPPPTAETNSTPSLDSNLVSILRAVRRANAGIESCARILIAHTLNKEILPSASEAFIALDANDEVGVQFAIEACSVHIAHLLGDDFDKRYRDVGWQDEWLPGLAREAKAMVELQRGEITFAEFKRRVKGGAS